MFRSNISKILTGWTITVVTGLTLFWLSRKSIVNRRHEDMVTRRRAKRAAIENNPDIIQQNINKN